MLIIKFYLQIVLLITCAFCETTLETYMSLAGLHMIQLHCPSTSIHMSMYQWTYLFAYLSIDSWHKSANDVVESHLNSHNMRLVLKVSLTVGVTTYGIAVRCWLWVEISFPPLIAWQVQKRRGIFSIVYICCKMIYFLLVGCAN